MSVAKSYSGYSASGPSILALLVDSITKLSASEQKLLWMELNKQKIKTFAYELDQNIVPHDYTAEGLDALIAEVRKNGRKKG
ncbi:MAG: hypothetical protein P0Y53_02330 [Candidatus Pseudobacter hemicellulosilyticus]|uniref:Uncharacterized protein n=1 Tax=Candidatus Pseudobacter hemicellulosilyticus TaxID=3121375 RepID=A0AAJ5WQI7_9BACT|nr:MAG: hypothetical protein P0Y53_02330 [Pseudobacter sp.]